MTNPCQEMPLKKRPENGRFGSTGPAGDVPLPDCRFGRIPARPHVPPLIAGKRNGAIRSAAFEGAVAGMQNAARTRCFRDKHFGYCTPYVWTKSATSAISSNEGFGTEIRRCESDARAESSSRQPRQQTDCATMSRVVRPSPTVLFSAAIILGTATFVAVPLLAQNLLAQNGEPPKPAEAGKAEPAKADPAKADSSKADSAKSEPAKSEPARTEPARPEPAKGGEAAKGDPVKGEAAREATNRPGESADVRAPAGPAGRGECAWLGERAVGLMWKDDLDTAFRHLELYDRFGCPGEHIQVSFRCVVRQGNLQKDPKVVDLFDNRVHACWMDPARPAEPASSPTAAVEKPGTK
jgi:hypothetical protein